MMPKEWRRRMPRQRREMIDKKIADRTFIKTVPDIPLTTPNIRQLES